MKDRHDFIWNIVLGLLTFYNILYVQLDPTWVGSEGWKTLSFICIVLVMRMIVSCFVPCCCKKEKMKNE